MDIAEEELQWEDEAAAEALEDSVDTQMVDPMTDEELGEDFLTLPEATSGSIASGNGKKSLQTLPEVTSTAREAMSGKSEAMSGIQKVVFIWLIPHHFRQTEKNLSGVLYRVPKMGAFGVVRTR